MASLAEKDCLSNPNFAVICSFMDRYAGTLGLPEIGYKDLQDWIEDTNNVHPFLIELHVRLLRRVHKKLSNVTADRWERGIIKFCDKYSSVDAWEIERFGYKLAKTSTKLTLLKNLMESQFDFNVKFKDKINEIPIEEMRFLPVGRDKNGMAYWFFLDKELNLRVYREDQDDVDSESWELVCRCRDDLAKLITGLEYGTDVKLDKQESSDLSEASSDINEDSGDSFKQKTPLGPSPLTIKQEPSEGENSTPPGTKSQLILKVNKSDIQSPSKMLKDKFVKEKGLEIQKIMCKMKEEGLVDSDTDSENNKTSEKSDEVDGEIKVAEQETDKDVKVKTEDQSNVKQEQSEDSVNTNCTGSKESKDPNSISEQEEEKLNENVVCDKTDAIKSDNSGKHSAESSSEESANSNKCVQNEKASSNLDENASVSQMNTKDKKCKDNETVESNKDVDEPSNNSSITEEASEKEDIDKQGTSVYTNLEEISSKINVNIESYNKQVESESIRDSSLNDTLADCDKTSEDAATCEKEQAKSAGDKNESLRTDKSDVKDSDSKLDGDDLTDKQSGNGDTIEVDTNKNECESFKSEEPVKESKDAVKCKSSPVPDKTSLCETDKEKTKENILSDDEDKSVKDSTSVSKEHARLDNISNNDATEKCDSGNIDDKSKDTEIPKESCDTNTNAPCGLENTEEQKKDNLNFSEAKDIPSSETSESKITEKQEAKKSRKRKADLDRSVSCSSTDDDEKLESETVQPSKRPVKTAIRKSPSKPEVDESKTRSVENETMKDGDQKDAPIQSNKVEDEINPETNETETKTDTEIKGKDCEEKSEIKKDPVEQSKESAKEQKNIDKEHPEEKADEPKDDTNDDEEKAIEEPPQRKIKGLVANSKKNHTKAQKRQAANSDDKEPVEPASKRSKLRGRVTSKGRGQRRGVNFDSSSSSDDDVPLSQMAGRGRGAKGKNQNGNVGRRQATADSPKGKKAEEKPNKSEEPEIPANLSEEEDTGRRRSARVRNLRARKKSPSPDYLPTELEESDDDFFDDDDDEFTLKSKKRKKKDPKEVVEEIPKGRNALRHEAKANKKSSKKVEEEEETPCVKCLRSHQPEWILLCDKCDAGYHTACLRPPLMIIPEGDWFCPPCEHTSLKEKLAEHLKNLDQAILKNDRLVRRKERLAFVSISLDNVLKEPETQEVKQVPQQRRRKKPNYRESEESETGSGSETGSSESASQSESSSEEERTHGHKSKISKQKFVQRACRSKKSVSYRFEEFDELIMDAIEEDLSIPKEPKPKKVKPPGISRGKDMSNILGVSDEEKEKKPPKKRKPRLTELDEDIDDDDDTDDYQLSEDSNASDVTKSSEELDSEVVSEDSIDSSWRYNSRSTRRSQRKGGKNRRYRDDFIVDSDFESDKESKRRSRRRPQRGKVNYREINSDETEVEDDDESFHSSELSDSDFELKRKKKKEKAKQASSKDQPRSGKRQRIRRVSSSSESTEEDSEDSMPRNKKGKKPPSKTARYDEEESDESVQQSKSKKSTVKKSKDLSDMSEELAEETETSESSETDVSDVDQKKTKKVQGKKRAVVKSDSEEEGGNEEEEHNESHKSDESESGWEEISIGSGEDIKAKHNETKNEPKAKETKKQLKEKEEANEAEIKVEAKEKDSEIETEEKETENRETVPSNVKAEDNQETSSVDVKVSDSQPKGKKSRAIKSPNKGKKVNAKKTTNAASAVRTTLNNVTSETNATVIKEENGDVAVVEKNDDDQKLKADTNGAVVEHATAESAPEANAESKETTPKKTRGRKSKANPENMEGDSTTAADVTPKKRGRKPKPKPDASETAGEESPVKKKRGKKPKEETTVEQDEVADPTGDKETKDKNAAEENKEETIETDEKSSSEKNDAEASQNGEKVKDDSPLSARSKQNAPVGVVKPEVRQGVIVENRQVIDGRLNENRGSEVNPLQGMRDLAMGSQNAPGHHQSSFTPYSQSSYANQNMPPGYMGQQGFQNYPQHGPHPSQGGPMPSHPYPGPHGIPSSGPHTGPPPQYPHNQGPMSPGGYHSQVPYMGHMQQGYYPGNFRQPITRPEGMGHSGPQSPPYQQGQFSPGYHPHQGPYQGPPHHGYPDHPGPYHMGGPPGPMPPQQGGPGPYPGMPYNYHNMSPQGHPRQGFGPVGSPQSMSPNQPLRPQTRHLTPSMPPPARSSPSSRGEGSGDAPNRGFMMDNILKPSTETASADVEDSAEVSDIDRYTSFLCKSE